MEENFKSYLDPYIRELIQVEANPLFLRILKSALNPTNILSDMESEVSKFLLEVLNDEN